MAKAFAFDYSVTLFILDWRIVLRLPLLLSQYHSSHVTFLLENPFFNPLDSEGYSSNLTTYICKTKSSPLTVNRDDSISMRNIGGITFKVSIALYIPLKLNGESYGNHHLAYK